MKKYLSPFIILANGTINMTASQLGKLGIDESVISAWNDFWDTYGDDFSGITDFDINKPETWAKYDFDIHDSDTWFNPLYYGED